MNPSKTLKNVACAIVIASATAGSFSATAQERPTVTIQVPSAKTTIRGVIKTIKKLSPYALTVGYFCWAEPRIVGYLTTKTVINEKKETQTQNIVNNKETQTQNIVNNTKGLKTGIKKVLDVFVGASLINRMKEDAEWLDDKFSGFLDYLAPAA